MYSIVHFAWNYRRSFTLTAGILRQTESSGISMQKTGGQRLVLRALALVYLVIDEVYLPQNLDDLNSFLHQQKVWVKQMVSHLPKAEAEKVRQSWDGQPVEASYLPSANQISTHAQQQQVHKPHQQTTLHK